MSGITYSDPCPNCNAKANHHYNWKPYSNTTIDCPECGLVIQPSIQYRDLEELNEQRVVLGLPELKSLPEQNKELH